MDLGPGQAYSVDQLGHAAVVSSSNYHILRYDSTTDSLLDLGVETGPDGVWISPNGSLIVSSFRPASGVAHVLACRPDCEDLSIRTCPPNYDCNNDHVTGANNLGTVVGTRDTPTGRSGVRHDINSHQAALVDVPGSNEVFLMGVNNTEDIIGMATIGSTVHAFIKREGNVEDIGTLGGTISEPFALNEAGHVVGFSLPAEAYPSEHGFFYNGTSMRDVGTLMKDSKTIAFGINRLDHVVGESGGRAFFYRDGAILDLNARLDSALFTLAVARSISDSDEIVGVGECQGTEHGFFMRLR